MKYVKGKLHAKNSDTFAYNRKITNKVSAQCYIPLHE